MSTESRISTLLSKLFVPLSLIQFVSGLLAVPQLALAHGATLAVHSPVTYFLQIAAHSPVMYFLQIPACISFCLFYELSQGKRPNLTKQ